MTDLKYSGEVWAIAASRVIKHLKENMKLHKILILFCPLFFAASPNIFAQSAACENAITEKYSGDYQDRYGNETRKIINMLQYYGTFGPGNHKFGNNNALRYVAVVFNYENGQMKGGSNRIKVWCVVNSEGKVLGLEREFN